jgi:predicted HTH transcriptional regulator
MNLKKTISQGESETVEFKKSPSESKEIIKTISAFANTKGGRPPTLQKSRKINTPNVQG